MLRRKNYWLLFAILLLSLTSLSPSMELNRTASPPPLNEYQPQSQSSSVRQQGESARLRIAVSLPGVEFRELQRISGAYALSSGVTVNLDNLGEAVDQEIIRKELTVGDSPDIVMTDVHFIRELARQGYLLPMDLYQNSPGGTPLNALSPLLQWNGYVWGVPLDIDPYVFVYSSKAMKELGAEVLPRSLDEWTGLLEQIRQKPGRYLLAMNTDVYGLSAFLESAGGSLLPASRKALDWVAQARGSIYSTDGQEDSTIWNMLQEGTVAAAILPLSAWRENGGSAPDLSVETPWTEGGGDVGTLYSRGFALSAQARNPEAAAGWLSYLTTEKSQVDWLKNTGRLPASEEPYRRPAASGTVLPFPAAALLAEGGGPPGGEPSAGWKEVMSAAERLLAGKLDAAGYIAAVSSSAGTAAAEDLP